MTKTRNKLKIMGLVLTMVLLIASLGVFSLTASAAETTESAIDLDSVAAGAFEGIFTAVADDISSRQRRKVDGRFRGFRRTCCERKDSE